MIKQLQITASIHTKFLAQKELISVLHNKMSICIELIDTRDL